MGKKEEGDGGRVVRGYGGEEGGGGGEGKQYYLFLGIPPRNLLIDKKIYSKYYNVCK